MHNLLKGYTKMIIWINIIVTLEGINFIHSQLDPLMLSIWSIRSYQRV